MGEDTSQRVWLAGGALPAPWSVPLRGARGNLSR
jgi:hypothetical protein